LHDGSYGAWVQLLASAAYDTYVLRLTHHPYVDVPPSLTPSAAYALVGLGIGAAGSEIQKAEILLSGTAHLDSGNITFLCGSAEINPWFSISAGTRLSARLSIPGSEVQQTVRFSTIASHYLSEV
jgi:hypothetical protein